jgi:hypothetical protein
MPESGITPAEGARRTGVPARTIRAWAERYPGLGWRDAGGGWRIDPDLLAEMAARRGDARRLTVEAMVAAANAARSSAAPGWFPGLTLQDTAGEMKVSTDTIRKWCALIPDFGHYDEEQRRWHINPWIAALVALKRGSRERIDPKVLAEEAERITENTRKLYFLLKRHRLPPVIQQALEDRLRAWMAKRRTPPDDAAEPQPSGEVRRGTK